MGKKNHNHSSHNQLPVSLRNKAPVQRKSDRQVIADQNAVIDLMLELFKVQHAMLKFQSDTYVNITLDAAAMANADVFQMGCGRAMKWRDKVEQYMGEFDKAATDEVNERLDYRGRIHYDGDEDIPATRTAIDARLSWIYNGQMDDFDKRYGRPQNKLVCERYDEIVAKLKTHGVTIRCR